MQQAAELAIAAPTIEAALDGRFLSGLKDERVAAAKFFDSQGLKAPTPAEVLRLLANMSTSVSSPAPWESRMTHETQLACNLHLTGWTVARK